MNDYIVKVADSCLPDVYIFPHCDFQCLILPMMKKYSLLVKLNQHITQLWMDRNSNEINLAKLNGELL